MPDIDAIDPLHNLQVTEQSDTPEAFRWTSAFDGKSHSVVPAFSSGMRTIDMLLLVSGYAHEFPSDYAICMQQKVGDAEVQVHVWCLNPGVAFRDLREQCRSVILTSGMREIPRKYTARIAPLTQLYRHAVTDGIICIRARL